MRIDGRALKKGHAPEASGAVLRASLRLARGPTNWEETRVARELRTVLFVRAVPRVIACELAVADFVIGAEQPPRCARHDDGQKQDPEEPEEPERAA